MRSEGNFETNIIHQGDCLDVMETLPSGIVDCLITDPPYFVPAAHYSTRTQFKKSFADLGIMDSFFKIFFKDAARLMKQDGSIYVFCDGQSYPVFYWHLYPFVKSLRPLIWDKKTAYTGFGWRHQHEIILWAEMPEKKPINTGDGDILRHHAVKVDERIHPAQKPLELIKKLIEKSTKEGDLIFDAFAGSGTTIQAAKDTGRNYIGCELNFDYYENKEKWKNYQPTLF